MTVQERTGLVDDPPVARERSFESFYGATRASTLAVVLALRGDGVGAEEVVQEAYLRAYRRWPEVSGMDRADLWVHRVALNLATSRLRRMGAEARALARLGGRRPAAADEPESTTTDFWRLVRTLPDAHARVVALHYAADLSLEDIADVLACPVGTVKSRLHHARKRLRTALEEGGR